MGGKREKKACWDEKRLTIYYSEKTFTLIPVNKNTSAPLQYTLDLGKSIQLPGAHGEEIVRDLFTDVHVSPPPLLLPLSSNQPITSLTYSSPLDKYNIYMRRRRLHTRMERHFERG